MKVFYFTATGNNLFIAKTFKADLYSIPQVLNSDVREFSDDKIGIVFPCYFMGLPRIVQQFFNEVKLISDYIFVVVSYGSSVAGTYNEVKKITKQNNLEISYINKVKMVDNYLPIFDINKELENKDEDLINDKIIRIFRDVMRSKKKKPKSFFLANIISYFGQKIFKRSLMVFDKKFLVTNKCNSCKVCEMVCPVNNIVVNKKPFYKHNCEVCLACIHSCPQAAIHLKKQKSKARYLKSKIELSEIIKANNVVPVLDENQ